MIATIIGEHPMQIMFECSVRFGCCGRSIISPAIHKSVSAKRIAISGSVFRALRHFRSASTDAVYLPRLTLWVHWYMCFIVSRVTPHPRHMLVVAYLCHYMVIIFVGVLLMNFVTKCTMWTVVVSRARLNSVRSISSQSAI